MLPPFDIALCPFPPILVEAARHGGYSRWICLEADSRLQLDQLASA